MLTNGGNKEKQAAMCHNVKYTLPITIHYGPPPVTAASKAASALAVLPTLLYKFSTG